MEDTNTRPSLVVGGRRFRWIRVVRWLVLAVLLLGAFFYFVAGIATVIEIGGQPRP
jgi:hypothetical protein